ncbi:MAG: alpha/beta hydrolase [Chloroflexota bacterium]|nr:alpha/beta hydrolase [Chloroflexota bacterium]
MPEVTAGAVRLHYAERPGAGEPIIFVHGHHGTHHAWDEVIRALSPPHRALAFDLRGCGDSDKPPDGYAPADYASDLVHAADALGIRRFTLVGYSLGGVAAVQAALEQPDRIHRLVLVAVAPLDGIPPDRALSPQPRPSRDIRRRGLLSMVARPLSAARIEQLLDDEESWALQASRGSIDALRPLNLGRRLSELEMPALVVVGDCDELRRSNLSTAELLPNAGLQVYYRASHLLPMELPGELAALIDDFMAVAH